MWEDSNYCWVVLCKNHWFHMRQNIFSSHRIPLGETDGVLSLPALDTRFTVRCDECGKDYIYRPSDVRRYNQELPESFIAHPLFRLEQERRRSQRSPQDVHLVVLGESAEKVAFQEKAIATSVNAYGALMFLTAKVELGQTLSLKNPRTQDQIQVRVVRFGPHRRGRVQVGVELAQPSPEFWSAKARIARE
jgi:hypothetical protein